MEVIHRFIKISLPNYLKTLPIPKSFSGFAKLSGEDWMNVIPLVILLSLLFYSVIKTLCGRRKQTRKPKVNESIQKEESKVLTQMDIEDIGDKIAFCRCWRSKKFPLCDGSHNQHNAATRDNVGPLLLRRTE